MGKSARLREERKQQNLAELERLAALKEKKKKKRIILSVVLSAVALLAAVAICLCLFNFVIVELPSYQRKTVVMETENFKIDGMMMAYYIYSSYETNLQNYGELGIDTTLSFKEQTFNGTNSWFDYFRYESQNELREILLFAEKAKAEGVTLTEEEKTELYEYIETLDISGYTEAFGLTMEDFKRVMELTQLASKMYQQKVEELNITDSEIESYYKENEDYFKTFSYKVINIPYGETGWFPDASTAKSAAEVFNQVTSSSEFDDCVTQLVSALGGTEEDAQNEISDGTRTNVSLTEENAFSEWAFDASRKVSDIYIEDSGSSYDVYILTALPTQAEADLRNVRHILLSAETCETDEKAKAKAEQLLADWKAGKADEQAFADLAKEYSEDTGSGEDGGLIEDVSQGEMIDEFDSWLFDASRKAGDTGIVKTDYGYHVMYYVGEGRELWQVNAENALISKKTDELCTEYAETWTVTVHDKRMNKIPL